MWTFQPITVPSTSQALLAAVLNATATISGTFHFSTKAVVGAAKNCMGVWDVSVGRTITRVTFDVVLSRSGAAYWTQVDVLIDEADTQTVIRSKTIAAVKAGILDVFEFQMEDTDVILSNYYIGA